MSHIPVLLKEVIYYLDPKSNQNFIDCTIGGGGHAKVILEKIGPKGKLLGIDLDERSIEISKENLRRFGISICNLEVAKKRNRIFLVQGNFKNLKQIKEKYFHFPIYGVLFDLGFSSFQVETGIKGFSFLKEGPLDMRYDPRGQNLTAEKIINEWPEKELIKILRTYGEEKETTKIARSICRTREKIRIKTTRQLADLICKVKKEKRFSPFRDIHPATKVFQALRIAVNDELNNLKEALPQALEILEPRGRLVVISFHSLEDRIVKQFFVRESKDCLCSSEIPVCQCKHKASLRILTKKIIRPTQEEVGKNPRSRSARLRAAVKISNSTG